MKDVPCKLQVRDQSCLPDQARRLGEAAARVDALQRALGRVLADFERERCARQAAHDADKADAQVRAPFLSFFVIVSYTFSFLFWIKSLSFLVPCLSGRAVIGCCASQRIWAAATVPSELCWHLGSSCMRRLGRADERDGVHVA
jgi:hypothetical protein